MMLFNTRGLKIALKLQNIRLSVHFIKEHTTVKYLSYLHFLSTPESNLIHSKQRFDVVR